MAYAEKRGKLWRARWRSPDGTLESKPGFKTRKDAEKHGRDQEVAIRANTYVDPRASRITLTDWVNNWYPALDLEPTTLANYRYLIEVHILPAFGDRPPASLTAAEISTWELALGGHDRPQGQHQRPHGPPRDHPPGSRGAPDRAPRRRAGRLNQLLHRRHQRPSYPQPR